MLPQRLFFPGAVRVAIYGGESASGSVISGAWTYDGTGWTAVTPDTGARGWSNMVYDSSRSRLIVFGGFSASSSAVADTWEY